MRNGIEYSKSKQFRIVKGDAYVVQELVDENYVTMRNGTWLNLNNARSYMDKAEALVCPQ